MSLKLFVLAGAAACAQALPLLNTTDSTDGHWCAAPPIDKHAKVAHHAGASFRGAFQDLSLWVESGPASQAVRDCVSMGRPHHRGNDGLWVVEFDSAEMMEQELLKIHGAGLEVLARRKRTLVLGGGESVPDKLGYDACGMEKDLRIISVSDRAVRGPRPMSHREKSKYSGLAKKKMPAVELILSRVARDSLVELIAHMQEYQTRNSYSGENGLDQAADWAAEQFTRFGFDVTRHTFRDDMTPQIVAELPGTEVGDNLPIVVVGAHYDSRGTDRNSPTQRAPGADDNGSGSAALVEFARVIHSLGVRFKHTLRLCLFTGEEQGLIGSRALASGYAEQGQNIIAMFNADMIGYKRPGEPITLAFMDRSVDLDLTRIAMDIVRTYVPELPVGFTSGCCSDQQSFHENGFASVGFFETPGSAVYYPQYHTSDDLLEHLDQEQIELQAKGTIACAATYLEVDEESAAMLSSNEHADV